MHAASRAPPLVHEHCVVVDSVHDALRREVRSHPVEVKRARENRQLEARMPLAWVHAFWWAIGAVKLHRTRILHQLSLAHAWKMRRCVCRLNEALFRRTR
eukprot:5184707-Pleurochrysis_carterae.AAC.2